MDELWRDCDYLHKLQQVREQLAFGHWDHKF